MVFSRNENLFLSFDSLNNFNAAATFQLIDVLKVALKQKLTAPALAQKRN